MATASKLEIDDMVTVGTLADKLSIPVTSLITELMKNGVMATVNEKIDFDTAQIIVGELGLEFELVKREADTENRFNHEKAKPSSKAIARPPVVAVMGHVDHGKTSLLDAIRKSNVAEKEAGGITQHISAYQIEHNKRKITFLDTPGHEAFAAIREHGAHLTDIVIIVVAADDGVKPQTIEAIRYARNAGAKILVAINKVDKEGADSNRVKQQLSEQNLLIEEWGGDTIVQEVSAKTGKGIKELLDMILLVTDVEELKADIDVPARGLIIESHIETGRGPVARALVEAGVLKAGQYIVAGSTYAKIRNLEDTNGTTISEALPSTPVIITGFKNLPEFGDEFNFAANEKTAKDTSQNTAGERKKGVSKFDLTSNDLIRKIDRDNENTDLNIVVKSDVQGSLTSVTDSLKGLNTEEVTVRFVGAGIGSVSESDVHLAQTSKAIIYGFNVDVPKSSKQQANRDKVEIRTFNVIYELIDDVKVEMSKLLKPEVIEKSLGKLIVKGIFKTTKTEVICGGEVTKGKLQLPAFARITRGKEQLAEVEVVGLKKGSEDVKEVVEGEMCGLNLKTDKKLEIMEDDKIELFTRETVTRKL
jgi:translation initiation factor IF-2